MGEKGREKCWRASLDSLFDYSDSILPNHSLDVCTGRMRGGSVDAGWLHSYRELGNCPGPQLLSIGLSCTSLGL